MTDKKPTPTKKTRRGMTPVRLLKAIEEILPDSGLDYQSTIKELTDLLSEMIVNEAINR